MSLSALIYVQHLLGVGHLKRALVLAGALADAGHEVTLVSGGEPVPGMTRDGVAFEQLPPVRAADRRFKVLVDAGGNEIDEAFRARRRDRLIALFDRLAPDLLITELFPFGRRQMRFELVPLLEHARAGGHAKIVASVRDILVQSPKPEREREMIERFKAFYDFALVHGDPALVPFERTFPLAHEIAGRIAYSGYVVERAPPPQGEDGRDEVIVSGGGGAVAGELLACALAARPLTRAADAVWRLLVGPNLDDAEFNSLAEAAPRGVIVERARPDFPSLLQHCRLSVSQGGYNTVLEGLAARVPMVVVPYAGGLETEQTLRAELLAERGLVHTVPEDGLSPERLAAAIDAALAAGPGKLALATDGARESAAILERLAGAKM